MERFGGRAARRSGRPRTPVWLCVAIIGASAWLYLAQSGAVTAANTRWQAQQQTTQSLEWRRQLALAELGQVEAPSYLFNAARSLGLQPGNWSDQAGGGQP